MKFDPEKTYRVRGGYSSLGGHRRYIDVRKKGSELSEIDQRLVHKRRIKIAKSSIAGGVLTGLLSWGVVNLVGTPGENISEENGAVALRKAAAQKYNKQSLREKFEMTYAGTFTVKTRSIKGGSGMLGARHPYAATFGQNCLSSTPYNTKPSKIAGDETIMPPASFHIDSQTGDALVTPYGSDDDTSLRFSVQNGELRPTTATLATLAANNCVISDGIPARTPRSKNGLARSDVIDISALVSQLHPGGYQG